MYIYFGCRMLAGFGAPGVRRMASIHILQTQSNSILPVNKRIAFNHISMLCCASEWEIHQFNMCLVFFFVACCQ